MRCKGYGPLRWQHRRASVRSNSRAGRMVGCDGFWLAAANRRADRIVVLMALKALMADALGGRATRRDDEDDVGKPERQPVADTLRSSPRQEGGERTNY